MSASEVFAGASPAEQEDARRERRARLDAQFRHGLMLMFVAVALFVWQCLTKGHPSQWVVGPRWTYMWGGDWDQVQAAQFVRTVHKAQQELFYLEREEALLKGGDVCLLQPVCDEQVRALLCSGAQQCAQMHYDVDTLLDGARKRRQDRKDKEQLKEKEEQLKEEKEHEQLKKEEQPKKEQVQATTTRDEV